jgi:pantetheine-phosphate adenylyltransferase
MLPMSKIAVFPGSFDPFTIGHQSIALRALHIFDKLIIAVGHNDAKKAFFPLSGRLAMIRDVFFGNDKVEVIHYEDLTVSLCKRVGAKYILRGLRTSADFEYERAIAQVNKAMYDDIESVFILTLPEHTSINSSIVREILRYGGNAQMFLPVNIHPQNYL